MKQHCPDNATLVMITIILTAFSVTCTTTDTIIFLCKWWLLSVLLISFIIFSRQARNAVVPLRTGQWLWRDSDQRASSPKPLFASCFGGVYSILALLSEPFDLFNCYNFLNLILFIYFFYQISLVFISRFLTLAPLYLLFLFVRGCEHVWK